MEPFIIVWLNLLAKYGGSVRTIILLSLIFSASTAYAECWTVGNLSGQSVRVFNQYALDRDGISNSRFNITLAGDRSLVTPSDLSCSQANTRLLVCIGQDGDSAKIETWYVDPFAKRAIYTHARSGYGPLDGGAVFVGEVLGPCQ